MQVQYLLPLALLKQLKFLSLSEERVMTQIPDKHTTELL